VQDCNSSIMQSYEK